MKKTPSQQLRLGIFVIIGSAILIGSAYFIGNQQSMFKQTAHLSALFNNVNGLQPGNNVRFSGIDIGTVKLIEMINDSTIRVDMAIDLKIMHHIKKHAVATISSDGLVGSMVVNILPGEGISESVADGDMIRSYSRIRTDDLLKTLNVTNENAALLTADLLKISGDIVRGEGSIGMLLKDSVMANDMKQTIHFLKLSSMGTTQSINKLNLLLASIDKKDNVLGLIRDTAVAGQIKDIVKNLERSSEGIDVMVANINDVVTSAKSGKGAYQYLTSDERSAQKVDSILININDASILLKEDLEAVRHNFLFRGYFKKKEKAKKRAEK